MATDYKSYVRRPMQEQISRQQRREKNRPASLPGWIWFAGGVLLSAMVMGIMWFKDREAISQAAETRLEEAIIQERQAVASQIPAQAKRQSQSQPQVSGQTQEESPHQFDFYNVLPHREVEVPPDSLRPVASKKPAAVTTATTQKATEAQLVKEPEAAEKPLDTDAKSQFQMQIASFRSRSDAERMMSGSALKGITTRIEKVTINDKAYYRVRSGPYSREQAYSLHKRLKKSGIESLIMRVKQ
ncbi:MAG: SPOR domain-containing protein [Pseudomonadota bacterium]|nr:SPOR domain-containing protein [Pseudomonadota bacterium]